MIKLRALFSRKYIKSLIWGCFESPKFKSVRTYCMFIGYQRSGHSFIGALLDAHKNISVGMEVDALNLVEQGYTRNQVYYCLVNNARIFTRVLNNKWTGYSYAVPGSYQGKYDNLFVIGDKKGGKSTLRLGENPNLFKYLQKLTNTEIKIFHVIRNPFDNISTMVLRYLEKGNEFNHGVLKEKIDLYFYKVSINAKLKSDPTLSILDIYHEDFIHTPKVTLIKIMDFLGLEKDDDYIAKCSSLVYKSPHRSRNKIEWPEYLIKEVDDRISQYPFLKHYRFEK